VDYLAVVTSTGKSLFLSDDSRCRSQIVKQEKIVTTTGAHLPHVQLKRQQFFLTLAGPLVK
jgi:hypothetical protein